MATMGPVEFGGPDLAPRRLRDLLQDQVDAAPAGSRIDWATYYFRDRALADALIRASDRGVTVNLVLEGEPRRRGANEPVISMLAAHGLRGGFHLYRPAPFDRGHLHAKIYAFTEPDIAWIGSFNPSGDDPEDAEVIAEIGDQDRGHNLLAGITSARLVAVLRRHVERLAAWSPLPLMLRWAFNRSVTDHGTSLYFYPRVQRYPVERSVARLAGGDRLRGAISHLKQGKLTRELQNAVRRGVVIDLLVHDTERRVPADVLHELLTSGVNIVRVGHVEDLPMHAKFLLLDKGGIPTAWLGSHNFNNKSARKNAELLVRTDEPAIIAALDRRFAQIAAMA